MSNSKWNACERLASAGVLEAQAKLLLERVRSGDLDYEMFRLAIHLRDPSALLAWKHYPRPLWAKLLEKADYFLNGPLPFDTWGWGFMYWGKQACVRATVATARLSLARSLDDLAPEDGEACSRAVEFAEDWVVSPSEFLAVKAGQFADETPDDPRASGVRGAWAYCVWAAAADMDAGFPVTPGSFAERCVLVAAVHTSVDEVRTAIRDELLPWCLGISDPLCDRVNARPKPP